MEQIVRDERVVFKVSEEELGEIEEAAREMPNCTNRSDFIRTACFQKIYGVLDREAVEDVDVGIGDKDLERIDDSVSQVAQQVSGLRDEFADMLESGLRDDDETDTLARAIYHNLPVHESGDEFDTVESYHIADAEEYLKKAQYASTPTAWARYFDADVSVARLACNRMLDYYNGDVDFIEPETYYIESVEQDGSSEVISTIETPERRYYKLPHAEGGPDE